MDGTKIAITFADDTVQAVIGDAVKTPAKTQAKTTAKARPKADKDSGQSELF